MKLGDWMDREGLKVPQFATRIQRTNETVRRYIAGERIPDRDTMLVIVEQTGSAVTPNDFFDLPAEAAA